MAIAMTPSQRLRSIFSGSVGNLVEWYDWYAYSAFAIYFAPHFFPRGDATAQLLDAAAVFALGFLMRPLGGWLMGLYADRHGRKRALMLSVLLMCAGSLLVALAPGYERIGLGATALLLFARLLQGLSLGGEYGTSATYLSEIAFGRHRGFFASFQYVTLIGGQLCALVVLLTVQLFVDQEQMGSWGWRMPFLIGALAAFSIVLFRHLIHESATVRHPHPRAGRAKAGLAAAQALALALRLGRSLSSGMSEGSGGCGLASSCSSSICALRGGALPGRQRS